MDALVKFIKEVAPMAEAIVELSKDTDTITKIKDAIAEQQAILDAAEFRLKELDALSALAKDMAEKAKAEVIQARSQIDQMLAGTKADAKRIISEAMNEATNAADAVTRSYKTEHANLRVDIEAAKVSLDSLVTKITARQADHDAVMASLGSLKARLG